MGLKDNHVAAWSGGLLTLKLSDEAPGRSCGVTRNKVSSHLFNFMLRRTRSTRKRVFAGLASGGINPPEELCITVIVPDGGLGGVYGGRGSAQDSCRTDAGMRKCDELSSCRSITPYLPYIIYIVATPLNPNSLI